MTSHRRRFPLVVTVLGASVWVYGGCNTYTPDLLGEAPIAVDSPSPQTDDDADDDLGPTVTPTGPVSASPDDCPSPPCDAPADDDVASDDDMPEPAMSPAVPTEPSVPGTAPAPTPTPPSQPTPSSGGAGGAPITSGPTGSGGSGAMPSGGAASAGGGSAGAPNPEPAPAGGSPPVVVPPTVDIKLIEDFEDGNSTLLRNDGRMGFWFSDGDPSGDPPGTITPFEAAMVDPPNASLPDSTRALHVVASGYASASWAVAGVDFNGGDAYDKAANYTGITFWGRAGGTESSVFAFRIPTASTLADDDHYGGEVTLTDEWVLYLIPFDGAFLSQQGFGEAVDFVPAEITGIQLALQPGETGFDIWIDDLQFAE